MAANRLRCLISRATGRVPETKTFNPKSTTGPFDIGSTRSFADIVFNTADHPVTASANGGNPIPATSCNEIPSQKRVRCSFPAKHLLPNGCKTGDQVDILVKGILQIDNTGPIFKFESKIHQRVIVVNSEVSRSTLNARWRTTSLKYVSAFLPWLNPPISGVKKCSPPRSAGVYRHY